MSPLTELSRKAELALLVATILSSSLILTRFKGAIVIGGATPPMHEW